MGGPRAKGQADLAARRRDQVREASARDADRRIADGMIRVAIWVPQDHVDALSGYALELTERRPALSLLKAPYSASGRQPCTERHRLYFDG